MVSFSRRCLFTFSDSAVIPSSRLHYRDHSFSVSRLEVSLLLLSFQSISLMLHPSNKPHSTCAVPSSGLSAHPTPEGVQGVCFSKVRNRGQFPTQETRLQAYGFGILICQQCICTWPRRRCWKSLSRKWHFSEYNTDLLIQHLASRDQTC